MIDAATKAASSVGGAPSGSRLLGMVRVAAGTPVPDIHAYLTDQLVAAAGRMNCRRRCAKAVTADLQDGLRLGRFVPHRDVADDEIKGTQLLSFDISQSVDDGPFEFKVGGKDPAGRPMRRGPMRRAGSTAS